VQTRSHKPASCNVLQMPTVHHANSVYILFHDTTVHNQSHKTALGLLYTCLLTSWKNISL